MGGNRAEHLIIGGVGKGCQVAKFRMALFLMDVIANSLDSPFMLPSLGVLVHSVALGGRNWENGNFNTLWRYVLSSGDGPARKKLNIWRPPRAFNNRRCLVTEGGGYIHTYIYT